MALPCCRAAIFSCLCHLGLTDTFPAVLTVPEVLPYVGCNNFTMQDTGATCYSILLLVIAITITFIAAISAREKDMQWEQCVGVLARDVA